MIRIVLGIELMIPRCVIIHDKVITLFNKKPIIQAIAGQNALHDIRTVNPLKFCRIFFLLP